MSSIQEQLQLKFTPWLKGLYDYKYIKVLGVNSTKTVILNITIDKFKNSTSELVDYRTIWCRFEFPGKEVPVLPDSDVNQTSDNTLMLYEILPIEAYFLSTENVKSGNIIFYKYIVGTTIKVIPLQIVNQIVKGGVVNSLIHQFIVAPITDNSIISNSDYISALEQFKEENNIV